MAPLVTVEHGRLGLLGSPKVPNEISEKECLLYVSPCSILHLYSIYIPFPVRKPDCHPCSCATGKSSPRHGYDEPYRATNAHILKQAMEIYRGLHDEIVSLSIL